MSKKILHTLFALAAALILTGGFSMTAYAGGGEEYGSYRTHIRTEAGAVNESCPVCLNNRNSCIGVEKETEPETEAEPER